MAEMHHPEYQIIHDNKPLVLSETLTPIYPTTEGLKQTSLRKLIAQAYRYWKSNTISGIIAKRSLIRTLLISNQQFSFYTIRHRMFRWRR